ERACEATIRSIDAAFVKVTEHGDAANLVRALAVLAEPLSPKRREWLCAMTANRVGDLIDRADDLAVVGYLSIVLAELVSQTAPDQAARQCAGSILKITNALNGDKKNLNNSHLCYGLVALAPYMDQPSAADLCRRVARAQADRLVTARF